MPSLVAVLGLGLSWACGGSKGSSPAPAPTITRFQAAATPITLGGGTTLSAVFSQGTGTIDHGVGSITSGAPVAVSPVVDTTYTLTVTGAGGTATRTTAVAVVDPPVITGFTASPATLTLGDASILTFTFSGGTGVIDSGVGSVTTSGTQNVSPLATTTYTLTVTNAAGTVATATVTVTVVPAPSILSFSSNGPVPGGTAATLTAIFSGGQATVDHGLGPIDSGVGLSTGMLSTSTTYTLIVTNAAGAFATATTTVNLTGDLDVTISGLGTLPADVTVSGPYGFSQHLTQTGKLAGVVEGLYTLTAATVADPTQPGLGRANGGSLGSEFLQRYPREIQQTVLVVNGQTASAAVDYPAATLTLQIPTKEDASVVVPLDFILVPGGTFTMGSNETADWDSLQTQPPHPVTLARAFYMAKVELTQAQWKAVLGATNNPSNFKGDSQPVEQVSWDSIRASGSGFLDQLNASLPGLGFRLPTEAEWEFACRAGTTSAYFFGEDPLALSTYAITNAACPANVATRAPNPWGLFDMTGNVREWQEDDSHDGYLGAPADGTAWVDSPRGNSRVVRGSCWDGAFGTHYSRSAYRDDALSSIYWSNVGFRLVLPLPAGN